MSYILDALRKADSQRERDASRGIHAQSVSLGTKHGSGAAAPRLAIWGAIAAGVVVIAVAGWYFTRTTERAVPAAAPQVVAPAAPVAAPADNALPPAAPLAMQPPVVPPAAGGNPVAANAISPPPPPAPMHTPPTFQPPPGPAPAVAAAPPPAAAPATATAPVTTGLPPDAPKVSISGGVYSPNPAQRMLIVNGQVFNEGSEVAPGLVVDKIEARTAVLRFRGARYTVAY
jgi:general secretion pathway protein B